MKRHNRLREPTKTFPSAKEHFLKHFFAFQSTTLELFQVIREHQGRNVIMGC